MVEAYEYSKKTRHRIDAVKKATRKLTNKERAVLPEDDAINGHLKTLIEYIDSGKCPTECQRGYQIVIRNAYLEITKYQISVNELCDLKSNPTDEQPDELDDLDPTKNDSAEGKRDDGSDNATPAIQCDMISSYERVEIAKYAIDQHYFFLKQLTGVI